MHFSMVLDIAGPGLLVVAAGGVLTMILASVFIVALEGLVLWRLHWGTFSRSLLASLLINFVTSMIGIVVALLTMQLGIWGLLIDYALSVLIEGCILILIKHGEARKNWVAALAANGVSYVLVILPFYMFLGLLG